MRAIWLLGAAALSFALAPLAMTGCGDDAKDRFLANLDAGVDAGPSDAAGPSEAGIDPTLGGPCNDNAQCDDAVPCTFDTCDTTIGRCRNTPDDSQCQDGIYCNGAERCVLRQGCAPGPVVTCTDETACTIDKCVEASKSCTHDPRDTDGDGDPDDHCVPHHDCDDTDPNVSSTHSEICGNFKDDNCNGQIDEQPCTVPANDTCAAAQTVTAAGTVTLTTVATKQDYATSCSTSITGGQDIVVAIQVPAGSAQDVLVTASAARAQASVAVTLEKTCGDTNTEIQCANFSQRSSRAIARSTAGGTTIYAIITTSTESAVAVKVDFQAPTQHPTNETCDAPLPITLETAFPVSIIDATKDLSSACLPLTGELTYSFTLATPRDVRIFANTTLGSGDPVVSLRDDDCATEDRCRSGSTPPLFVRALSAGTHVFSVSGPSQIDASVIVQTSAPTSSLPDESCATAPELTPNQTFSIDLTSHEDAISDGCFPHDTTTGGAEAARALTINQPSDVLVIARYPSNEVGTVSLDAADCSQATQLACSPVGTAPLRISKRNIQVGSYRVVVGDQLGQSAQITALVRPTAAPVTITADACSDVATIPETGGFFTGDTTTATADFGAGCDQPGQPAMTAKDQLLKLTLTAPKHVIFDMSGSAFRTLLDIRTGEPCPGVEVADACNQDFAGRGSFLDLPTLAAGTYYVQIDGYAGEMGKWNLDVRVLDP